MSNVTSSSTATPSTQSATEIAALQREVMLKVIRSYGRFEATLEDLRSIVKLCKAAEEHARTRAASATTYPERGEWNKAKDLYSETKLDAQVVIWEEEYQEERYTREREMKYDPGSSEMWDHVSVCLAPSAAESAGQYQQSSMTGTLGLRAADPGLPTGFNASIINATGGKRSSPAHSVQSVD